jgi:hypothetical protein
MLRLYKNKGGHSGRLRTNYLLLTPGSVLLPLPDDESFPA